MTADNAGAAVACHGYLIFREAAAELLDEAVYVCAVVLAVMLRLNYGIILFPFLSLCDPLGFFRNAPGGELLKKYLEKILCVSSQ